MECGIVMLVWDGVIVQAKVNQAYCEMTGCTQEEIDRELSGNLALFIPEGERGSVLACALEQARQGEEISLEYNVTLRSGARARHQFHGVSFRDRRGRLRAFGAIEDLTAARTFLRERNRGYQQLQTIIHALPGGLCSYTAGGENRVSFISQGMLGILGCTRRQFFEKYDGRIDRIIHPDDYPNVMDDLQCLERGDLSVKEAEFRIYTYDGALKWLFSTRGMMREEDGTVTVYVISQDVTRKHEAQSKLEQSRQGFLDLANSTAGGIAKFCVREDGIYILSASDGFYRMFGLTRENFPQGGGLLIREEYAPIFEGLQEKIRRGEAAASEFCVRKGEEDAWIRVNANQINGGIGETYQGTFVEITDLVRTRQALERERERYRAVLKIMDAVIFEYDLETDTMVFTEQDGAGEASRRVVPDYTRTMEAKGLVHPDDVEACLRICRGESLSNMELRLRNPHVPGRFLWHSVQAAPILNERGHPVQVIGALREIDAHKQEEEDIRRRAQRDALTGLYNQAETEEKIKQRLESFNQNSSGVYFILDVDNFKQINDTYGHFSGDEALRQVSDRLSGQLRATDIVGRIGGDEFVAFLPDVGSLKDAQAKGERILQSLRGGIRLEGRNIPLSVSIGGVFCQGRKGDYCAVYRLADQALYEAKRAGKDSCRVCGQ